MVDLAGSENARLTGAMGDRLAEAGNINKSLLTLSRVISQLAKAKGKAKFINWRDSKLTQILQPSLAGNCRTAVICCVTPASQFMEETRSTLNFASRAKQIRTHAVINEVLSGEGEIQKLKSTVRNLQLELEKNTVVLEEKKQLEEKICNLTALLISGGKRPGESTALTPSQQKKRRKKKHRETWCPGQLEQLRSSSQRLHHSASADLENVPRSENSKHSQESFEQNIVNVSPEETCADAATEELVSKLEEEVKAERDSRQGLLMKIDELSRTNTAQEAELLSLKKQSEEAQAKLKQCAEDEANMLQTVSETQRTLLARCERSEAETKLACDQVERLVEDLEKERATSLSLSAQLGSMEQSNQDAVAKLLEVEKFVSKLESGRAESQAALQLQQSEIETLKLNIKDLDTAKSSLEMTIKSMQQELDDKSGKLREQLCHAGEQKDLQAHCENLKRELDIAQTSLGSTNDKLEEATRTVQQLRAVEESLKHEAEQGAEVNNELRQQLQSLSHSKDEAVDMAKALKLSNANLAAEISKYQEELELAITANTDCFVWANLPDVRDLTGVSTTLSRMYASIVESNVRSQVDNCLQRICQEIEMNTFAEIAPKSRNDSVEAETCEASADAMQMMSSLGRTLEEYGVDVGESSIMSAVEVVLREKDALASELDSLRQTTVVPSSFAASVNVENMKTHYEKLLAQAEAELLIWKSKAVKSASVLEGQAQSTESHERNSLKRISQLELSLQLSKQETEKCNGIIDEISKELKRVSYEAESSEKELQSEIESLLATKSALSKANEELDSQCCSLKLQLSAAVQKNSALNTALRSEQQHGQHGHDQGLQDLEKKLQDARFKEESMMEAINALERKIAAQAERIEERDGVILRLEEQCSLEQKQESEETVEMGELRERCDLLNKDLQASSAEVHSLHSRLSRASKESERLAAELEASTTRAHAEATKLSQYEKKVVDMQGELASAELQVRTAEDQAQVFAEQLREVTSLVARHASDQRDDLDGSAECEGALHVKLGNLLSKAKREVLQKQEDIDHLNKTIQTYKEELALMKDSAETSRKEEVAGVVEKSQERLEAALKERDVAQEECKVLEEQLKETSKLAMSRLARIEKLEKTKLSEAQCAKIMETKKAFKELKVKYAEVVSTNKRLSENFEYLKEHASRNKAALDKVVKDTTMKFGILDYIEPEDLIPMITEKLEILQAERDALESELRANESDQKLEDLFREKTMTEEKLAQVHSRLQEEIRKNIKVTNEVNSLKAHYSSQSSKMKNTTEDLSRRNEEIGKQIDSTKQELLACQAELANAEARCRDFEAEKVKSTELVQSKFSKYEEDIAKLKSELQALNEMLLSKADEHKQSVRFLEKENLELMVQLRKLREERRAAKTLGTPEAPPNSQPLQEINGNCERKPRTKSSSSLTSSPADRKRAPPHLEQSQHEDSTAECKQQ